MSDSTFGLKIGVEGEREFKKALTEINREMRVLGSEMKVVASQFDKNDSSVAALAARSGVLSCEVEVQRGKIDTLRKALENSASSFGENDARTQNWRIQLNNATVTLNDLERELGENTKALDALGDETSGVSGDLRDAAKGADRLEGEVDDLGDELDKTGGKASVFGDVLKANLASDIIIGGVKAIGAAVKGIGRAFVDALRDGVSYNSEMEQYTTSFTTMLGDQAKAQQLVNDLKREAAATPFGMGDLAKNTQTLLAFGISAEEAQVRLKQLGDISQGDSQKLESLTLAFAQVSSAGKLTGQDLLQMINAGFNPLEEISRQTGKSIGELKEEMSQGAISADMIAGAFASATAEGGRFYGAMEAQSKTFTGQLSTLEDGVANLKGLLAGGLTSALAGSVLPMVNGWVDALTEAFENDGAQGLITALQSVLQEALTFISDQLPTVMDTGLKIVTALLDGVISVLPSVAQTATTLIVSLTVAIITALPSLVEAATQIIATLASGIGQALPELVPAAVQAVMTVVQGLADNLPILLTAALTLITGLADGLIAAIPVLIDALPGIISALVDFLVGAIPQIMETGITLLTSLVEALPTIIERLVAALPQLITALVNGLLAKLPDLVEAGIRLFTSLIDKLPYIIRVLLTALPQIIASIVSAIGQNLPAIMEAGVRLFTSLVAAMPRIVWEIVQQIPQIITGIVTAIGQNTWRMVQAGADLVRGLWQGIQNLAGWLWDNVSSWCSNIWDGITSFFGIHSPSKAMAWVGDMLTRGLAQGIEQTGDRAVTAATHLAQDTLDSMSTLTNGIDIPLTLNNQLGASSLLPPSTHTSAVVSGVDVAGLIEATAKTVLNSLDVRVVLHDGTLVGKLAPMLNQQLAALGTRQGLLRGGV